MTSSVVGRIVGMLVCWHWWPIPLAHKYWKVHSHGFIRDWSTWSVTHKVPTKIKVPQIVTKCVTGQFQTSNSIGWKGLRQDDSDQLHTTFHSTDLFCIVQKMKANCYFALGILGGQHCCCSGLKDQLQSKSSRCWALQQDTNRNSGHQESGSLGNAKHAVPEIGPNYVASGPRLPVATLVSQVSIWGVCNTTTIYKAGIRSINLRYHPALGNSPEAIAVWS